MKKRIKITNKPTHLRAGLDHESEIKIRITRAGYIYLNGKKVSPRRVTPFYYGQDVLTNEEQEVARKWANSRYVMVNN